jgi:bis(5'-nucleosyl)-tetraphosphatase (symmetrical)
VSLYVIGDVQGCYSQLQSLVEKIAYDPSKDRLAFVGDLVNRGPQSLEVLRYIRSLENSIVVLGNHDLYLLAVGYGVMPLHERSTMHDVLQAPDKLELLDWLRQQPLLYHDAEINGVFVHAGIPPQWSVAQALSHAQEVGQALRGSDHIDFLASMYGDQPLAWSDQLTGAERLRYIVNALTRMRYCAKDGALDLLHKGEDQPPPSYQPWFDWYQGDVDIYFGHWAYLQGKCDHPRCYALDTGCVYGSALTAMDAATGKRTAHNQ